MKREQRLRSPVDFRRVREVARRGWTHPLLLLHAAPNELGHTRVGITVSGRVGNAVIRNRVRRRLREALRDRFDRLPPTSDVVLTARAGSARASWADLCTALDHVIARSSAAR